MISDVKYWENVFKLVEEISLLLEREFKNHNIEYHVPFDLDVNPFYKQIEDNGGIGIAFYNGFPHEVCTPLGYVPIDISALFGDCGNMIICSEIVTKKLISKYGLKKIDLEKYAVTKLPWSKESIPIFHMKDKKNYIPYDDAKKFFEIIRP